MNKKLNILILEKTNATKKQLYRVISNRINKIDSSRELSSFKKKADKNPYNIIFITSERIRQNKDLTLSIIKQLITKYPAAQIIILADQNDMTITMESIKAGSYQYARLPVPDHEFLVLLNMALETKPNIIEEASPGEYKERLLDIVGSSQAMQTVYRQIEQAASSKIPVLILGETGTGKDLVAQSIHKLSLEKEEPYHPVNLGALPSDLIASELFGHEKGSFTGALNQHIGVFEQAKSGTVFLDEIDSIDEKVQISLLRLLENKSFKRLGGRKTIFSDARLIAASNEDLEKLIDSGGFRSDLFYRLDVFRIHLPPLRERKSDINLIVNEFFVKYSRIYKKRISNITNETLEALSNSDWPGNIRELKNVIQRAVLVCNSENLELSDLPPRFSKAQQKNKFVKIPIGSKLEEAEREIIIHTLAQNQYNRKITAEILGISRRALYNKIERLQIKL